MSFSVITEVRFFTRQFGGAFFLPSLTIDVLLVLDRINQIRHLILLPLFHFLTGSLGVAIFFYRSFGKV